MDMVDEKEQMAPARTFSKGLSDFEACTGDRTSSSKNSSITRNNETVFIFDWDDTLLSTSAINAVSCTATQLEELQEVAKTTLNMAMGYGETYIITNGNETWVQDSCETYFPGLLPTIRQLKVISARAQHEMAYPGNPFAWKQACFHDVLSRYSTGLSSCDPSFDDAETVCPAAGVNLLVLGDSPFEMEAARSVQRSLMGNSVVKTVKFKESPTCLELMGQLRRVQQEMEICVDGVTNVHRILMEELSSSFEDEPIASDPLAWDLATWSVQIPPTLLDLAGAGFADNTCSKLSTSTPPPSEMEEMDQSEVDDLEPKPVASVNHLQTASKVDTSSAIDWSNNWFKTLGDQLWCSSFMRSPSWMLCCSEETVFSEKRRDDAEVEIGSEPTPVFNLDPLCKR